MIIDITLGIVLAAIILFLLLLFVAFVIDVFTWTKDDDNWTIVVGALAFIGIIISFIFPQK